MSRRVLAFGTATAVVVAAVIVAVVSMTGGREGAPAPAPGFDGRRITVGALVDLTGLRSGVGEAVRRGHETYWAAVNRTGGVAGRYPVDVEEFDTASDPVVAVSAYRTAAPTTAIFSTVMDLQHVAAAMADDGRMAVAGDRWSSWAAEPSIVLNLGFDTIFGQMATAPGWAITANLLGSGDTIGFLGPDLGIGEECRNGFESARSLLGLEDAFDATYAAGSVALSAPIEAAAEAGVDVLVLCSDPQGLAATVAVRERIGSDMAVIANSGAFDSGLMDFLGGGDDTVALALLRDVYLMGAPETLESGAFGPARLIADLGYNSSVSIEDVTLDFVRGYTDAATAHAVLEAALQFGDVSPEGLWYAATQLAAVDLGWGFGPTSLGVGFRDRIPTMATTVGAPAARSEFRLGLRFVSGPIVVGLLNG